MPDPDSTSDIAKPRARSNRPTTPLTQTTAPTIEAIRAMTLHSSHHCQIGPLASESRP